MYDYCPLPPAEDLEHARKQACVTECLIGKDTDSEEPSMLVTPHPGTRLIRHRPTLYLLPY